jgi:hypothetical protein
VQHRVWTTALCTAVWLIACRRPPEPKLPGSLPLCYRLTPAPWRIPQDAKYPEQREVSPLPQLLVLEPSRTEGVLGTPPSESPWRLATGYSSDPAWAVFERAQPLRGWRIDGDMLFTAFSMPFGGLQIDFRVVGDSLVGTAEMWTDMGGVEYPSAAVTGVRVRCPRR